MKLILYNNFSESNKLDKTIVKIIELDGNLREASSLINPSILIELNPNNISDVIVDDNHDYVTFNGIRITWNNFIYNYVLSANYVYIPEFNRYYFINDIISIRTNMWRLNMHVDVLMSYKNQIKQMNAFVNRNEFEYDEMVKDDMISYYYDKEVSEYIPTKGDKVNTTFRSKRIVGTTYTNYVLSVINDQIWNSGDFVNPPDSSLPQVGCESTGQGQTTAIYVCTALNISRLARALIEEDYSNLYGFVNSVIIFPFSIANDNDEIYLRLGKTDLSDIEGVKCYKITPKLSQYYVIADFTINGNTFMDYEPYTQYQIWLPYLSWVNISADDILNNRIIVYYVVNYQTGTAQVTIYDVTNGKNIFTSNCQLGVKIGLSSTNAREVKDNETSNNIGLAVGLLTSALAVAGGVVSGNAVAVGGGVLSGGKTIANYVQNQNTNYLRASGNISDANSGYYQCQDVKIRKTIMKPKNYDENYAKLFGKPLNKYMKIEDLSGYTILGDIHIEDIGSITSSEFDELYAVLTTGFII